MMSEGQMVGKFQFPAFSGVRVMMLPIVLGRPETIPPELAGYAALMDHCDDMDGEVAYLTVDEKRVQPGATHRRPGLHVDGSFRGKGGSWGGGGFIVASSFPMCRAWFGEFDGEPGDEGECDHLAPQLGEGVLLGAGEIWKLSPLCVHQSMPAPHPVDRQFVRLSMPNDFPWFEGYTESPYGVMPTGPVLPKRKFMDE